MAKKRVPGCSKSADPSTTTIAKAVEFKDKKLPFVVGFKKEKNQWTSCIFYEDSSLFLWTHLRRSQMPSMIISYLVCSNINLYYRLHYPAYIPCLEVKWRWIATWSRGESKVLWTPASGVHVKVGGRRSSGGHGVCSKPRGLQRDVCVGGLGGGGCLEKFTETARRVTTQQSDL